MQSSSQFGSSKKKEQKISEAFTNINFTFTFVCRIYSFLKSWAEYYPLVFEEEEFNQQLQPLLLQVSETMGERFHTQLVDCLSKSKVRLAPFCSFAEVLSTHRGAWIIAKMRGSEGAPPFIEDLSSACIDEPC